MIYLESNSNDPHFNLALEQYVFDEMDRSQEYLMLWQNANAIIVGKHQNTFAEINRAYVEEHQVAVVRRLSGGGAVYHDLGNLNYTIIADNTGDGFDFAKFCRPVVAALNKLGVPAEISGRNDMTVDGKKFSGNAQYIKQGRIMHHGTILYSADMDAVSRALAPSQDKMAAKGIKSVRSRVANIQSYMHEAVPLEVFKRLLVENLYEGQTFTKYTWTAADIARTKEIQAERYGQWDWNYGSSQQFSIVKERRFEGCGKLELHLNLEKGLITSFDVFGDYFGNGDKSDLQKALVGKRLDAIEITKALSGIKISDYFNNLAQEQFIHLLLN